MAATSTLKEVLGYLVFVEEQIPKLRDEATVHDAIEEFEQHYSAIAEGVDDFEKNVFEVLLDSYVSVVAIADAVPDAEQVRIAHSLLEQEQVAQRTDQWYAESRNLLTASELNKIFKSPRTRGQLVMSKAVTDETPKSVSQMPRHSTFMTPFDWGIRYEPIVKRLYEKWFDATVAESGRLYHPTLPRCAASPDGIVLTGPRAGRLIEIKCPVTREIGGDVPEDYYAQMQQQLEVTGLELCDYLEVKIRAPYSTPAPMSYHGPALPGGFGVVWLIERTTPNVSTGLHESTFRYVYSEPGTRPQDPPELAADETVMERAEWELLGWHLVTVRRNRGYWQAALPKIDAFWADVEAARNGTFTLPEGRARKVQTPKEEVCQIILTRPQQQTITAGT